MTMAALILGSSYMISSRIRRWLDAFLKGHYNYYTNFLPKDWGLFSFLSLILRSVFSHVSANPSQADSLKQLSEEAVIVYASKYKSNFEFLFYHVRYKADDLPFPQIGFDHNVMVWQRFTRLLRGAVAYVDHMLRYKRPPDPYTSGYFKKELLAGRAGMLSLVDRRGFYHRFVKSKRDPIGFFIELQREIDRPIHIVPQWFLFSKTPQHAPLSLVDIFFGSEENPGWLRRWTAILRTPQKAFVEIADPVNVQDFLLEPENEARSVEQLSFTLRMRLLEQMNRHRQSITGPILKTKAELKELILRKEDFQAFLKKSAKPGKTTLFQLYKKADTALDEIAADYSPRFIQVICMIFGWVWKTMFDGVSLDMEGLNRVKRAAARAPIVFVPCHRSHFDYMILPYLLVTNNMPFPHVAAGQNLAFWPVGTLFRKSGAFFIRRSFHGARLYARVFSEYVHMLVRQGFNMEFFIEGGRSRTGKMILPKTGLLTILIDAYKVGACRDLVFAPVFVGYDRLLEENALLGELEGKQKKKESLGEVLRLHKLFNKRHGRVYVQFSEPISLKTLVSQENLSLEEMSHGEYQALGRNLAYRIINAINRISVVTPQGLTASAVLNHPKQNFTINDLMPCIETYLNYLIYQDRRISDNLEDTMHAMQQVLALYTSRKFIESKKLKGKETDLQEQRFSVLESKRLNLEYYKNNCIHHFVPAAYTALAILSYDAFQFSASELHADYKFLQDFFKYEFAYDVDQPPEFTVRKTLKAFIQEAILIPHRSLPDTYNITSAGFRKLLFFASFLKTYFESYWVVFSVLKAYGRRELVKKERVKKIRALGLRMYKQQEIERKEALSMVNYENGLAYFNYQKIRGKEDEEKLAFHEAVFKKYLGCFTMQK